MAKKFKFNKEQDRDSIKKEILATYTIDQILDLLIDYVELDNKRYDEDKPITVSEEEYNRIVSLFKVRGYIGYGTSECKKEYRGRNLKEEDTPKRPPKKEQ